MKKQLTYQEYLAEKHNQMVTSQELLEQIIHEATGSSILNQERIIAGEVNEVYRIMLKQGASVILRIARKDNPEFEQEQWAIDQCKKVGVPVPEILLIKHMTIDDKLRSFCVQRNIDGDTLERGRIDFHTFDKQLLRKIINQAGELLAKIHTIPTKKYGWLTKEGEGHYATYQEMVRGKDKTDDYLFQLAKETQFGIGSMRKIITVLNTKQSLYKNAQTKLCHGDYGPKHIMVDKNYSIVGIIDFGGAASDSPIYDFAWWDYWFGTDIPIEWLKEGYSNKSLFDEQFDHLFHFMKLYRGVWLLDWYHKEKFQHAIERAKKHLDQDLKYFL